MFVLNLENQLFSLNGTVNSFVDLTSSLKSVQGNNPRSISFMIQTTTTGASYILNSGIQSVGRLGIKLYSAPAKIQIVGSNVGSIYYFSSNSKAINDGLWHSVLLVYDGTTLSLYVDGILYNAATKWDGGSTFTSTLNTVGNSNNYLGQMSPGNWLLTGNLKNVLFYDYAITNSYALANSYQSAGSILYSSGNSYYIFV